MPRRRRNFRPGDRGKHTVIRDHLGKSFDCDSRWEAQRIALLDLAGYRLEREHQRIPYTFQGRPRTYYPDLFVFDRFNRLIRLEEIKPMVRVNDPINQAKFAAARLWCAAAGIEFLIVTERNIREIPPDPHP